MWMRLAVSSISWPVKPRVGDVGVGGGGLGGFGEGGPVACAAPLAPGSEGHGLDGAVQVYEGMHAAEVVAQQVAGCRALALAGGVVVQGVHGQAAANMAPDFQRAVGLCGSLHIAQIERCGGPSPGVRVGALEPRPVRGVDEGRFASVPFDGGCLAEGRVGQGSPVAGDVVAAGVVGVGLPGPVRRDHGGHGARPGGVVAVGSHAGAALDIAVAVVGQGLLRLGPALGSTAGG